MSLNIYLTFDGNCRSAFEFYQSVFGGDYQAFQTFEQGPEDMRVAEDEKDKVMHVSLPIGDGVLMGSDNSSFGPPLAVGNNFSISVEGESRTHCDEVFERLSEGGAVTMPLQEMFWGSYYGMLTDKFGIKWMVSFALPSDSPSVV